MAAVQYPGGCVEVGEIPIDRPLEPFTQGAIDYRPASECASGWIFQDRSSESTSSPAIAPGSVLIALVVLGLLVTAFVRARRR